MKVRSSVKKFCDAVRSARNHPHYYHRSPPNNTTFHHLIPAPLSVLLCPPQGRPVRRLQVTSPSAPLLARLETHSRSLSGAIQSTSSAKDFLRSPPPCSPLHIPPCFPLLLLLPPSLLLSRPLPPHCTLSCLPPSSPAASFAAVNDGATHNFINLNT
jgi:hypothetical protein